jgi:hypothetical protein
MDGLCGIMTRNRYNNTTGGGSVAVSGGDQGTKLARVAFSTTQTPPTIIGYVKERGKSVFSI